MVNNINNPNISQVPGSTHINIPHDNRRVDEQQPEPVVSDSVLLNVSQAGSGSISPSMSAVYNFKGLEKDKYEFEIKNVSLTPDGTILAAYSDDEREEGNYIAVHAANGKIKWEARGSEKGINSVKAGVDGSVCVHTKQDLRGLDSQGKIKFSHPFLKKVDDKIHFVDSLGNNYFSEEDSKKVYIVDSSGNIKKAPLKLRNFQVEGTVRVSLDDSLWTLKDNKLTFANFNTGKSPTEIQFDEKSDGKLLDITDFSPTKDGGALLEVKQHNPRYSLFNHKEVEDVFVHKLDRDGNVEWKTKKLGRDSKVVLTDNDRAFYFDESRGVTYFRQGLYAVKNNGETEKFTTIEGDIRLVKVNPENGEVFVQYKKSNGDIDAVSKFAADGTHLMTRDMDGKKAENRIHSCDKDGNLVLTDRKKTTLQLWNPETDILTPLTNHRVDYSFHTQKTEIEVGQPQSGEKDYKVEINTDHVTVGGVKLPKKKNQKWS
jgi:hypothetical protein